MLKSQHESSVSDEYHGFQLTAIRLGYQQSVSTAHGRQTFGGARSTRCAARDERGCARRRGQDGGGLYSFAPSLDGADCGCRHQSAERAL